MSTFGTETIVNAPRHCQWCGNFHGPRCPSVQAIEYHQDGSVKRVEFVQTPPIDWQNLPIGGFTISAGSAVSSPATDPGLLGKLQESVNCPMTPAEKREQRLSFVRGMTGYGTEEILRVLPELAP